MKLIVLSEKSFTPGLIHQVHYDVLSVSKYRFSSSIIARFAKQCGLDLLDERFKEYIDSKK